MNSTNSNRLVEVPPGRYVRAGGEGEGFKEIIEPTQGLIVEQVETAMTSRRKDFKTVLVDGDLINIWTVCG